MIENLYELVGGNQNIEAATERFYEKVLEDDNLRHFFGRTAMTAIDRESATSVVSRLFT